MKSVILKKNHLNPNSFSYISDYLQTLGIAAEDVVSFIDRPRNEDEEDPTHLEHMIEYAEIYHKLFSEPGHKIFVQVDSDTDGYTSASIIINYLRRRYNSDIVWRLHDGKEHGVIVETVPEDCDIVIIPDAGSNQNQEIEALHDKGKYILILDHHEISDLESYKNSPAHIINNQVSPQFINKSLSGAGVVYKFIKQLDRYFEDSIYKDYGDLAAIGIIADSMDMSFIDNNYIAYYGLQNVHSKFIKELAVKQSRGIKNPNKLTKIDVAFYIAPQINGVIRGGDPEDKIMVFRALTEEKNTDLFEHTWRGVTKMETLYERAVRLAANAKSRQDSAKKKSFEWLCGEIRTKGLDKHNIIITTLDKKQSAKVSPNVTGLIAMELVKEFNKPCLVLRDTEYDGKRVFGGSGRNGKFYNLPDLKAALQAADVFYAEGHANAFGAFLLPEQIDNIVNYFDTHINGAEFEDAVYEVDYWFHTGEEINLSMLRDLADYGSLWGNSIPQPKFAFDANFSASNVTIMGENKDCLRLNIGGVDCVLLKKQSVIDELNALGEGHITIVGRAEINEYNGFRKLQIQIDDIAIIDTNNLDININDLI